jgi:hypothetical protein
MAYSFASASSQYLSVSSAVATAAPLTLACWVYKTNVADANSILLAITNEVSPTSSSFNLVHNVTNNTIRASAQQSGGVAQVAISTSGLTNSTWGHACAVFDSSTSRTAYCNGGNSTTTTGSSTPASLTRVLIGAGWFGSLSNYANGLIAEVGIWNAALTTDEIASLAKGMTCDKVRPQSLVFYAPLVRELQDVRGGLTITNNNTATVANHPRVYA